MLCGMLPDAGTPPPAGQPESSRSGCPLPEPIPPLLPGQPPLAVLVDYDGTISLTDVSDKILYELLGARYAQDDAAYTSGLVGSRTLFESQVKQLPGDPGPSVAIAEAQAHDLAFADFVRLARELQVPVEIVSDGFGFFIEPALHDLGVPDVPVITARTFFDGTRAWMEFPNGHPDCLVCGTCKRQRVLGHQAAGRTVAFIGDGESDRYAAAYSDIIFAKHDLARLCRQEGWPFGEWHDFAGMTAWLEATVAAWRADPQAIPPHLPRPFICGPEVWGPGRKDPPHAAVAPGWTLAEPPSD
jgi:2-hydroxy-3-keto-5-methylthiopentenyl-1-phosphate phosphatase